MDIFTCSKCGGHRLEEVMINVTVASTVTKIWREEPNDPFVNVEYGEQTNQDGDLQCYQCMDCGLRIATTAEELAEVIKGV